MKHIMTINKANLKESAVKGGCGKCQASCQSACKTSCTVANQKCERYLLIFFKIKSIGGNILHVASIFHLIIMKG